MIDSALVNKWDAYMPAEQTAWIRGQTARGQTARLLENQNYYFKQLREENSEIVAALEAVVGKDWEETILRAIGESFPRAKAHRLLSVQTMPQPVCIASYVKAKEDHELAETAMPIRSYILHGDAVAADNRTLTTRLMHVGDLDTILGGQYAAMAISLAFDEAFETVLHGILAEFLALGTPRICSPADLEETLQQAQMSVHRSTGCGIANRMVGHTDHANTLGEFHARGTAEPIVFPFFPRDKILLLRQGASSLDASAVWLPFVFTFEAPEQPEFDPNDLRPYPSGLAITIRHAKKIVDPRGIAVVQIGQ